MCSGNGQNVLVILENRVVDHLIKVLEHPLLLPSSDSQECPEPVKRTIILKESALQLLTIMLEETHSESATVIKVTDGV